jgi:uncharacterized LabA/DUF88 family protein
VDFKIAILIDGGFFHYQAKRMLGSLPENNHIVQFARACARANEHIFRIFYYNAYPYGQKLKNPLSGAVYPDSGFVGKRNKQFDDLAEENLLAFRKGNIRFGGWKIKDRAAEEMISGKRAGPLMADDLRPDFKQKSVDIKIGLDVAWLSSRRIVDRMVLVTGDTDFVPAMKHARREGVQVVIMEFPGHHLSRVLREHSDEHREISYSETFGFKLADLP